MRSANHLPTFVLASLVLVTTLAACGCQTATKPVALVPPATAPALKPAAASTQKSDVTSELNPAAPQSPAIQEAAPAQDQSSSKAADASTPAQSAPLADAIADLIARVEKEYQSGVENFQAGRSDEARQNFDDALNTLLDSNVDVRSDERLQKEFDRVVEGVNQLYPGGPSAEADAQQEQKSEPAPIDETNDLNPAASAAAKAKAEAEVKMTHSDLPLMMTDQVAGFISYFSGRGRGVFERAFARSGRYHDMIVQTLKEEGVPQDLIYLAQAESGFHPLAVSRVGARGIWQFMASRARGYGLSHNMYVDDRQDPEKSTRAAARHLKDLYNQFGDWYLAMAAYNSGPGTVQAAVKRTGYADFWELYNRGVLPKETRNYVPIILAVTIMTKNRSQYGLEDVAMDHPVAADTVTINYPVDLRLVAECVNSTAAELQELNPSLLRVTTPRTGEYNLRLPAGTKDQYETAIAAIPPNDRLWWRFHTVHTGDTLASLARTYHTTAKQISEANHLDSPQLETDARIVIPVAPGKHPDSDNATYARRITRYKVHRGDTVESVAENFGVSAQMLRRWNGLRGNSLSGRRVLALHLPITPGQHEAEVASSKKKRSKTETASVKPPATKSAQIEKIETASATRASEPKSTLHHKVRTGETLYSIANAYRTTVAALKRDNRNVAVLHPGMILIIHTVR
ncbi:MAG TPA: LysM peptidoglycan-binding domain-containing protein [Candidatus Solibacter sp.]|nr:LysM peptidoglycan-binding domain-containing protein [Candidatus Solibacter sp.]